MKSTLRSLGIVARDNPRLRSQIGLVIDAMKHLARDPDRPGLRKHAAEHIAVLAAMRKTVSRPPDGGETWPIGG